MESLLVMKNSHPTINSFFRPGDEFSLSLYERVFSVSNAAATRLVKWKAAVLVFLTKWPVSVYTTYGLFTQMQKI